MSTWDEIVLTPEGEQVVEEATDHPKPIHHPRRRVREYKREEAQPLVDCPWTDLGGEG